MTSKNPEAHPDPGAGQMVDGWAERIAEAQEERTIELAEGVYLRKAHVGEWTCRDCGVKPGQLHVPSCCVELCARCDGQAYGCPCIVDDGTASNGTFRPALAS